ncbi:MAG: SIS domain-containing protein [Rhodopseudomonas sp.]|nr:SIS domain-containing protein [Rhodopseudomonas sp.]
MNQLDQIFARSQNPTDYARAYSDHLQSLLQALDIDAVGRFIETLIDARSRGARIFFCGNGGSAATASHFANDIAIGTRTPHKPFKAISLTDNNAVMTAIANDFGYDELFTKQLEILMEPGDIVVAISASGNSPNVVKAIELAKSRGNKTVVLTGFDGGKMRQIADLAVHIQTAKGEYGPVEDMHMFLDHLVGTYLMRIVHAEAAG